MAVCHVLKPEIPFKAWLNLPYMGPCFRVTGSAVTLSGSSLGVWCCLHDQSFQIPNIFKGAVSTLALSGVVMHLQSHLPGSVPESQVSRVVTVLKLLNVRTISNTNTKKVKWILVTFSCHSSFMKTKATIGR